jgi:type VI secretion system protein ImpG
VDDFLSYYTEELASLRDLGAKFAGRYPKVAGRLLLGPDECEDPHIERLLEGFAFLAARIRRKIDDEFPEITDALLQVLYPHYVRPIPSMSVVQLQPGEDPMALREGFTVAPGTRLFSAPVAGVRCAYQMAYPVTLWPVEVERAGVQAGLVGVPEAPLEAAAVIRLGLRCQKGVTFAQILTANPRFDVLRFYLDGVPGVVHSLHELLLNHVCGVTVQGADEDEEPWSVRLPAAALQPVGFESEEAIFPYPSHALPGYRLLQEYFAFPEKFLFVDITGLKAMATAKGVPGAAIELLVFLDCEPPAAVKVQAQTFRLGCTPVTNLFPVHCEPIRLDQTRTEYRVIPDVDLQWAHEVYSIDEVTSAGAYLDRTVAYEPFYSLRHATSGPEHRAYWYATRRRSVGESDSGTDVFLSFVNADFRPQVPATEAVSVRATCTNRDVPARLAFGGNQGEFEVQSHGPISRVARCLRKPTPSLRPRGGRGAQWRLISHLSLNYLSLAESGKGIESLREILRLYDWADDAVSRQQINGIRRVSSRPVTGRVRGRAGPAACMGIEVTVEFDESHYVGSGVFLLASVLERFFGMYATINSFSQLVATTHPEGLVKRWPPRAGNRTLL